MRRLIVLLVFPLAAMAETILCLGDSLTAGLGLEESQAYPALVEGLARADGRDWRVVNAGVSGDTTAGALRRLAWALKAKPDRVLIALGGNDGLRGIDPDTTAANLRLLIEQIRAAGATPLLAGMQLPTNYGHDHREAFARIYPDLANETQVRLLPFLLVDVGGMPTLNQPDGIHPNAEGQVRVAHTVYAFLVAGIPAATVAP